MNRSTDQPVAKTALERLDDLLAVRNPASEWAVAFQLTDREEQFIQDLAARRGSAPRPDLGLTNRQAAWLARIHRKVSLQLKSTAAMAQSTDFGRRGWVAPEGERVLAAPRAKK